MFARDFKERMGRLMAMAYDDKYDKYRAVEPPHNVIMEGRRRLSVSGVDDVESFDENEIIMSTSQGVYLSAEETCASKLSLDSGDVILEGEIDKLEYEDTAKPSGGGGFFARLFK